VPSAWLQTVAAFYDKITDPVERAVVASHVDKDWRNEEQFCRYLADHIKTTEEDLLFLRRWEKQLKPGLRVDMLKQDLDVSNRLLAHITR
jgi:hypothetical protein